MAPTAARPYFRFMALFFMCFLCFGPYFCYDLPGSLQDNLEHDLKLKVSEIMFLYSIYSWPNVVFCFLGGYVLDKFFGIRIGTSVYLFLTLVGQLMFAFGAFFNYYILMLAGRFIFGIGCESTAIASNAYAVSWFKGKEINMVFGLLLSCARIGSAITFLVSEPLYKWVNQYYKGKECVGIVIMIASATCLISFVASLILGCMDKYRERSLLVNEDDDENGSEQRNTQKETPKMQFSDVKRFPVSFWLIAIIVVAYYIAIFPFISIAKKFFMEIFHLSAAEANKISSIQYVTATISSPLFGCLVDKVGLNLVWVFTSIVYTISAHSILTFTAISPYIGMLLLGLSYSLLASSLWPLISLIVPEHNLGTAYGICQSIQNLGLAVFTIIVGKVIEQKGYIYTEVIFQSSLYFTLIVCSVLWILNSVNKGTLNFTKNERLQYLASRNETTAESPN